ncbi:monovalent cation/H+ antiporter subunit D [Salipiger pallidus]|uniref:Monovalent cation/H+ antiporter subunit D n=2 Tax=Salipiger pallidus TaxID=1775170 RepID=A0A8J3EFA8_9RHOB|nr:monovalent cation/H+ antiporter subunit D [Salipiger pallidus]
MMAHWLIAPVVVPALVAPMVAYVMRFDIVMQRAASMAASVVMIAIAIGLMVATADGTVHVYRLGDWPAPFGIVLVLDRLAALLILLTTLLGAVVLLHASATGWDRRGRHFHALMLFQVMGISGAFLTGDAFNLFVLFEILLIASYGLTIHAGGRERLKGGLQYVIMNLVGSSLFLIALGTLYATTGTLNIADLAVKVREIPVGEAALVRVAAMLLMIVFAVKAALFPVQFWLPGTYANAPAPVAALFAIMTKVGAYAILRMHTIVFGPDTDAIGSLSQDWLMPAALITIAIGGIGVMGARNLMQMVSFAVLMSTATLMLAISAFTPYAIEAALYYLVHSTFSAALMFLVADLVLSQRRNGGALAASPVMAQNGLLAALFFGAAIAIAGMPPLSGFLGKLYVLDALRDTGYSWLVWTVVLVSSLITIVGLGRAGSTVFWKANDADVVAAEARARAEAEANGPAEPLPDRSASALAIAPSMMLMAALVAVTVFAGPLSRYMQATSAQLFDPVDYIEAVLLNQDDTKDLSSHGDDYGEHGEDDGTEDGAATEGDH